MVTAAAGAVASSSARVVTAGSSAKDQEDRFLKLLVAQLSNQDPLNPLDNAAITSQMAQLSTVTGIEKLNATLSSQSAQTQAAQAASLIGHSVVAPGSFINLITVSGVSAGVAGFELPSAADKTSVSVVDASGNVVRRLDLGRKDQGVSLFSWDGKTDAGANAPDGAYHFVVAASQGSNNITPVALAAGDVNSVLLGTAGSSPKLSVSGLGQIDLSAVKVIL